MSTATEHLIPVPPGDSAGLLVAVEGIDDLGKSTLVENLGEALTEVGRRVHFVTEFGEDPLGTALRELVERDFGSIPPEAQPLLIAADRVHRYREAFALLSEPGVVVLCDRFIHTALIYQGVMLGVSLEVMSRRIAGLYGDLYRSPDVLLLLEAPIELAVARGGADIHDTHFLAAAAAHYGEFGELPNAVRLDAALPQDEVTRIALGEILARSGVDEN